MRVSLLALGAAMVCAAGPAFAQDTAPPPAITINGTATIVSDYRFRGISQTDKNVAVQGSITVSHQSGLYVSAWGSSTDDYVTASGRGHQELDLIAGYKKTVNGTTFDVGVLYYVYPKSKLSGDQSSSDFIEPYVSVAHTLGPATGKLSLAYAPKQKPLALDQIGPAKDNVYLAGDLSLAIPKTPISLTGHLGHTWGPSWLSIGKEYTDWNLGVAVTHKVLTLGISYVDTDGDFITPTGKNASKSGVVASLGVAF